MSETQPEYVVDKRSDDVTYLKSELRRLAGCILDAATYITTDKVDEAYGSLYRASSPDYTALEPWNYIQTLSKIQPGEPFPIVHDFVNSPDPFMVKWPLNRIPSSFAFAGHLYKLFIKYDENLVYLGYEFNSGPNPTALHVFEVVSGESLELCVERMREYLRNNFPQFLPQTAVVVKKEAIQIPTKEMCLDMLYRLDKVLVEMMSDLRWHSKFNTTENPQPRTILVEVQKLLKLFDPQYEPGDFSEPKELKLIPQFREYRYKNPAEWKKWLRENCYMEISFVNKGQELSYFKVYETGEILDCDFDQDIFLGKFIDVHNTDPGNAVIIWDHLNCKTWKPLIGLIIDKVKIHGEAGYESGRESS